MTLELLLVALIVFLGAGTRSLFGFGDAAVAMPLLALVGVEVVTAVPLVGVAGLAAALLALAEGRRDIDREALKRLTLSTLVGIPIGLLIVAHGSETLITRALGVLLVAYGTYSLLGPALPALRGRNWPLVFGFAAGSLGSAYNFNGVPVAVYGTMRRWTAEQFRSTLHAHFIISSILVVAGQGLGGLWTAEAVGLFSVGIPAALVAVPTGKALQGRVTADKFTGYVFGLIVVLGILLLV